MPTIEVWVALGEDDSYEVATDKYTAIERLEEEGSGDELAGTICRVVKLNITMSEPHDDDGGADRAVDVVVPDDAGHIVQLE
jgi:hypothetical protein